MLKIPERKPHRYKILLGPHVGETHDGFQIGARFTPDGEVSWNKTSDRVWIPTLKMSFLDDGFQCEDLVVPFDKFGQEICLWDYVYAVRSKGVIRCSVIEIGKKYHQGCGWHTRILKLSDVDTKTKFSTNNPHECIKTKVFEFEVDKRPRV